eukprot:TRINITY_DN1327_c0_g1_i4.p1 TRINITY_DN1327_c0_g1~~TRINITY_DN1327_c0_g1_i4.p1  ORF type:complete len:285 (+),score=62.06 TRINITY_DN1327_c0_g1_i4:127-981(+)
MEMRIPKIPFLKIILNTILVLFFVYLIIFEMLGEKGNSKINTGERIEKNKEVNVVGFVDKMDKDGCFSIASMLMYDYTPNIYTLDFELLKEDKEGGEELIKESKWHLQTFNKMKIYNHYCHRKDVKKDDLIILSDIQDVAYMRSASKFYDKFYEIKNNFNKSIFLSSFKEINPFGHRLFSKCPLSRERAKKMYEYLGKTKKGQFVNSGLLVGEVEMVTKFLAACKQIQQFFGEECKNEQLTFSLGYFFLNDWVGMDDWDVKILNFCLDKFKLHFFKVICRTKHS